MKSENKMNLVKRSITLVLAILIFAAVSAQNLLQMIPKEATFVSMINTKQIKEKGRLAEMMELPFMQEFDQQIAREFSRAWVKSDSSNYWDLNKHGINTESKAYSYFVADKEMFYGGMLLKISNQEKFKSFVKILTKDPEGEKIRTEVNFTKTQNRNLHIVWDKNTALFFGLEPNPIYKDSIDKILAKKHNYNNYTYEETIDYPVEEKVDISIEEKKEENKEVEKEKKKMSWSEFYEIKRNYRDSIKNAWAAKNTPMLIDERGMSSFASNTEFVNYVKSSPEMAVVFDYGLVSNYFAAPLLSGMSNPFRRNNFLPYLMSFYGDMKIFAKVNFKQDVAELSIDSKYGNKMSEVLKKVKKKKISKKFLKYLNNNLMGYYAMGLDIDGVGEGMKSMLKKTLPDIPEYGKAAVKGIEILEVLLDEKAIYNVFSGDALFAVNGIEKFKVEYKTYDYDEDFNRTEIIDTLEKELPEVIFMAEIGNQADVRKIIDLLVHLKAFKKEGNIYSLDVKRNDIPVSMRIHNGILFISNNKGFIMNPQELSNDKQLSKEHKKAFRKNTVAGFVNMAEIMHYLADNEKSSFKDQKRWIATSNFVRDIKMVGYKKGDYMHAKYSINLAENEDNSLVDIIKFANQLYLIDKKRM